LAVLGLCRRGELSVSRDVPTYLTKDRQHEGCQQQRRDGRPTDVPCGGADVKDCTAMTTAWHDARHTVNQIRLMLASGRRAAFQRNRPSVAYSADDHHEVVGLVRRAVMAMPTPTATPRPADREATSTCRRTPTRFEEAGSWSTVSMCGSKESAGPIGPALAQPSRGALGVPAGPQPRCRASSCDMRSTRTCCSGLSGARGRRMAFPGWPQIGGSAWAAGGGGRSSRTSRRRAAIASPAAAVGMRPMSSSCLQRGLDLPHCNRTIPPAADGCSRTEFGRLRESGRRHRNREILPP